MVGAACGHSPEGRSLADDRLWARAPLAWGRPPKGNDTHWGCRPRANAPIRPVGATTDDTQHHRLRKSDSDDHKNKG
ncbi:hypothetical protein BHE74_00055514 [Ensete ventricosum]|nr:hypothetical protein GW17_00061517 [Ensete ventricosum]RWW39173.1 hypothetical protein BHE74_00055514 [Ensete ventricosum]RZS28672.1 hypothetical protein BHM03_00062299 [Ensete ventricosum]